MPKTKDPKQHYDITISVRTQYRNNRNDNKIVYMRPHKLLVVMGYGKSSHTPSISFFTYLSVLSTHKLSIQTLEQKTLPSSKELSRL